MKTNFTVLLYLLSIFFTRASTYYVSNNGNNSQSGDQNHPWETLQYASNHVVAGDSVIVLSGQYSGFDIGWENENNGTSTDPIVFLANTGATIISKNQHTDDGINIEGTDFIIIDGFTITNNSGTIERAGIRCVTDTGVIIRNNTIDGMGTWGIFTGFSENVIIENNSCSNSIGEHGIYHSNSADNPIIRYNTCFSNNGCGIHMNGDVSMGGDGIISNALVEGNIIYDNGNDGGSGINCDGVQNSIFRNNLLYNNHASGISLYNIDGAEPATNNVVINNTILMASDGRWAINIAPGSTNNTVCNNILFNKHSYHGGISCDNSSLQGFTSDYNVTCDIFTIDDGNNILSLEQWRNATDQDKNSKVSTPEETFVNSDNNQYSLKSGCDAINNGISTNAPSLDIEKKTRPADTGYDIGAYEYYSGTVSVKSFVNSKFMVFPNPARQQITITSESKINNIELIDGQGRRIRTEKNIKDKSVTINIPDNYKGILFIRAYLTEGVAIASVITE